MLKQIYLAYIQYLLNLYNSTHSYHFLIINYVIFDVKMHKDIESNNTHNYFVIKLTIVIGSSSQNVFNML